MSSQTTNSARRLHAILQRAFEYKNNTTLLGGWTYVLEVPPSEVNHTLDEILILCQDIRKDIQSIDIKNSEKYLNTINAIRYFLFRYGVLDSNIAWNAARQSIEKSWLDLIDAIADLIDLKGGDFLEIHPEELETLQNQVRELIDEIKTSELDLETKKFLIKQLRKIEESLLDYHIRGSIGVEEVEKEVFGRIISEVIQNEKLQKARDIVGKVFKYLVEIDKVVKAGEHFAKLPHFIQNLLPPH